jgi:hypothetical protein
MVIGFKKVAVAALAGAMVMSAIAPALANGRGAQAPISTSGNVVSWTGGAIAYDVGVGQPDGNIVYICIEPTPCSLDIEGDDGFMANPNYLGSVAPAEGATSVTITANQGILGGQKLGAGEFYVLMMLYTRDGGSFTRVPVGDALKIIVPEITPTQESTDTGSGGAAPAQSGPPAPAIGMALQGAVGSRAAGTTVSFTGVAMKAGSRYVVTVNSEPIILAQGEVAEGGRISGLPRLPEMAPGTHTLTLVTTGSDGSTLTLSQVFVVGDDGRFVSISDPAGSVTTETTAPKTLAYTGVPSTTLPWWALVLMSVGMGLVLYSARALRLASASDTAESLSQARSPWEILATPIRVPGVDYSPGTVASNTAVSLGESVRELDLALSKIIADQVAKMSLASSKA